MDYPRLARMEWGVILRISKKYVASPRVGVRTKKLDKPSVFEAETYNHSEIKGSINMFRARRHSEILEQLQRNQFVVVRELAKEFGVAESTIRRDLEDLEQKKLIQREYGGAVLVSDVSPEPPFQERKILHREQKAVVGKLAAEQIVDDETIFIDGGTTTEFIIPHILNRKGLTVVTCGLNIVFQLLNNAKITTILTGGVLDVPSQTIVPLHIEDIGQLHGIRVIKSFISAVGVSVEFGVTNNLLNRIPTKQKALEIASSSYLVVDGSKIGALAMGLVAPVTRFDAIITDTTADKDEVKKLQELGVQVLLAESQPRKSEGESTS